MESIRSMCVKFCSVELLGGIGDVLIALRAIQALARSHPAADLTVLTLPPGGELLESDPLIKQVIYADGGNPALSVEVVKACHSYDLIVSDTNYDGIDKVIQNSGATRFVTNLWRSPPEDERVGDRFLQILRRENLISRGSIAPIELHLTAAERSGAKSALGFCSRPLVFLCPDAGMQIKRWKRANFVALGQTLQEGYGATVIVLVGSDLEQAAGIVGEIGNKARIWPRGYPECPERIIGNFTEQRCWYSGVCPLEQSWHTCMEAILPSEVLAAAAPFLENMSQEKTPLSPHSPIPQPLSDEWAKARNILVMRLDNIGDVIMTSPAVRAIKENLPSSSVTLMTSPSGAWCAPLLPWVDEVWQERVLWQDLGKLDFDPTREWELVRKMNIATSMLRLFLPALARVRTRLVFCAI